MIKIIETKPDDPRLQAVEDGLTAFNQEKNFPRANPRPFSLIATDNDGNVTGGLIAKEHFRWLHISVVYSVNKKQGLGRQLMQAAETYAQKEGLKGLTLTTFEFQAPGFYEKLGFEKIGVIPNYIQDQDRFYYCKRLQN